MSLVGSTRTPKDDDNRATSSGFTLFTLFTNLTRFSGTCTVMFPSLFINSDARADFTWFRVSLFLKMSIGGKYHRKHR